MFYQFKHPTTNKRGVTLVELLVVIIIIGILFAILLPVINSVRKRGQITAISLELQNLKSAVEQYKQTYGDYPPDGSNWLVMQRHIMVAFPRISPNELEVFHRLVRVPGSLATYMDPSEALVFFLGGFSDDPRFPFTGEGGPFSANRSTGLFEFDTQRLTIDTDNLCRIQLTDLNQSIPIAGASIDEATIHGELGEDYVTNNCTLQRQTGPNNWQTYSNPKIDVFPAYLPENAEVPYVYFDSRTYITRTQYGYDENGKYCAQYPKNNSQVQGLVRPFRSDVVAHARPDDIYPAKFIGDSSFQIISAGIGNNFGTWDPNGGLWKHFPTGENYSSGDESNIASFSRGALEDELP
tara:strand:+ start:519 stop:1574 length:1056 start_codon:yes stop_codon:yes gene_type:complete